MKRLLLPLAPLLLVVLALTGCLTTPVGRTGGPGAFTVQNTNPSAIVDAAGAIFPRYGYTVGPVNFPTSISFDKPAGSFDKLLYGSYGVTTSVRVKLVMTPIPGSNDYRLSTKVYRVSDAGQAGFEESTKMMSLWSSEFKPILRDIAAQAGGAGPM